MTLGQNVPKLDALHLMDGIEGLRSLPKHSVDMLLTDPPYGTTRNFWDVPLPLPELWEAVRWAVKPTEPSCFSLNAPLIRCWAHPTSPCSAMSGFGTRSAEWAFSMQTGLH